MTQKVDFNKYSQFVNEVTSQASCDFNAFQERLVHLSENGCEIQRLLTASVGISAEAGEFMEILKKIIFQGKEWNEDNYEHLKIELGDIMWYVAQACIALDVSFDEIIERNVNKLMKRYPGGQFDVFYSENRAVDDR